MSVLNFRKGTKKIASPVHQRQGPQLLLFVNYISSFSNEQSPMGNKYLFRFISEVDDLGCSEAAKAAAELAI